MNSALERFTCKKKTLSSVIHIFICVGKIYGLAPYSFPATNKTEKCDSLLNFMTNTLIALGVSTATIFSYAVTFKQKVTNKPKLYVTYELIQGMKVVSCAVIILHVLLRREKFVKACNKLQHVDLLIKNIKKTAPHYGHYFLLTLTCISIPILHLIYIVHLYYVKKRNFYDTMMQFFTERLQQEINLLVTIYYLFYVSVLHQRFACINKVLVSLNRKRQLNESLSVLRAAIKMHENLCKGAKYFNEVFSLPLFLIIICQVPELLLLLYMIYRGVEWNETGKFVGFLLQALNILWPIRLTYVEEQLIPVNLAEIEICYENAQMSSAKNSFLLQTLHCKVYFTASEFFPLQMGAVSEQLSFCISILMFLFQLLG